MASAFSALFARLRHIFSYMTEINKCIQTVIYFKDNIAAFAAVTAVRAAVGNINFSTETHMAISAVARFDKNFCAVCKHGFVQSFPKLSGL